jgi:large subunit ribosomal protein L4
MPRKALLAARKSAFLAKFQGGTTVVDELSVAAPRTKEVASTLAALGIERTCLIAIAGPDAALWKSTRNIPRVTMKPIADVNAYDLLHTQRLLITRAALEKLLATLGGSGQPAAAGAAKE